MDAYVGQIMLFAGSFSPDNWLLCDGRSVAISTYQPLYTLIGCTYGGDGITAFNVPDLRGRVPIHAGNQVNDTTTYDIGSFGGVEEMTLSSAYMPTHTHAMYAGNKAGTASDATTPIAGVFAASTAAIYGPVPATYCFAPNWISDAQGGGQAHDNMMPFIVLNWAICFNGVWPAS